MAGFDAVIFDCDGVLVDSEVLSGEVLLDELRSLGLDLDMAHFAQHFLGRSFPKVARSLRDSGAALPDEFENRYRQRLLSTFETRLRPTPGVERVLGRLSCQSCVATSSTPQRARRSLEICRLAERFGAKVFTASQVANGKPAPDLFLFAAAELRIKPERCLVIEDSLPGVEAATAAGMAVWRYVGGAHFATGQWRGMTPAEVPVFDDWARFFDLAPELELREIAHEHQG